MRRETRRVVLILAVTALVIFVLIRLVRALVGAP